MPCIFFTKKYFILEKLYTIYHKDQIIRIFPSSTANILHILNSFFKDIRISTGYRCGDLLKLKFCNFLNEDNSWKNEIDIIEQKTKKRRTILITDSIKEALGLYIKNVEYHNLKKYVFKSQKGKNKLIGISPVRNIFNNMALDLKLPYHCSTHFLRKTFAYRFLQVHKDDMSALATLQDIDVLK